MCGIIGYVGQRACKPLLLQGLERLEYRGYDSAGIALLENGGLDYVRAVGNLQVLKDAVGPNGSQSSTGLGHTRWATHGRVSEDNAHPLTGCDGEKVAIVLNGIVENYRELKESLLAGGHVFSSETDAEVVVHLVERAYAGDLVAAVRDAYAQLEGHFAFVVIHHSHPNELVGARRQCPLVVGVGEGEMFLASSIAAFLRETRRVQLIEDDEIVGVTPDGARFTTVADGDVERDEIEVDWDDEGAEKQGYETFMLKEIYEQPESVRETIGDRIRHGRLELEDFGLTELEMYTRCGLEVGVAASKTFTAQVALFYLIALKLAQVRKTLPEEEIASLLAEIEALPDKIAAFLDGNHPIEEVAQHHFDKPFFLYLGRHIGLPVCLEGALKLKEISYIPTEAYSAGEMKHGPIALLDEQTPVVCVATDSHVYEKVVSNIQETRARGAKVIAIATDGNEDIQHHADDVIYVPRTHPFLQAALAVVPLQLLAYRIARLRGLNVDQPRNLAKTVTVE